MTDNLKNCFAFVLAGHDKGKIFYIVDEDDAYVYLADGRLRPIDKPKKKKKKHIRPIKSPLPVKAEQVNNSEIIKAIKEYTDNVQG